MSEPGSASRVLLGVTGGIAAYKAVELCRLLQQAGHSVGVIQTRAATEFVGPATFAALTGEPVITGEVGEGGTFPHLDAGRAAGVLVVAPTTASTIARMAAGIADDVLVATYLAFDGPVVVAPAMNVRMWQHPATQRALEQLRRDGVTVVAPESGLLACGDVGEGRLAPVEQIAHAVELALAGAQRADLRGTTVVVTAGGTREPIDDVRWITNRSSGRMGVAVALDAQRRGADVRLLVTRTVDPQLYAGIEPAAVVDTARELEAALDRAMDGCDVLVMAAAVSDFTPRRAPGKLARGSSTTIELDPVPDLLAALAQRRGTAHAPLLVGFAAEIGADGVERARGKLAAKGVDMIVHNDVGEPGIGFEAGDNRVTILTPDGADRTHGPAPKSSIAASILDEVARRLDVGAQRPVVQ